MFIIIENINFNNDEKNSCVERKKTNSFIFHQNSMMMMDPPFQKKKIAE